MKKEELIYRMETIIGKSTSDNGVTYRAKTREWQNYGKDRTYFAIAAEEGGRTKKEKSYGYLDNITGAYHPDNYGDLRKNYTFGGSSF